MRRIVALASVAMLLAGCCTTPTPPSHYRVVISPVFTAENNDAILAALADWQSITPVTFDVIVGDAATEPGDAVIFIHPADANGTCLGLTQRDLYTFRADVSLYPLSHGRVEQASAHELGHAMGLEHVTEGSAVMYADPDLAAPGPTALDALHWREAR